MAVAVPCAGFGFAVDNAGNLVMDGPRALSWPNVGCPIEGNNGLKYDPATGKVWVAPADTVTTLTTTRVGIPLDMTQGTSGNGHNLGSLEISHTGRICTPSLWTLTGFNNYVNMRQYVGNWWVLQRTMSLYYNDVGIGTVVENVAAAENNSGGCCAFAIATSVGIAPPTIFFQVPIQNGDTIKLVISFFLDVIQHGDDNRNSFTMRWPTLQSIMWSHA